MAASVGTRAAALRRPRQPVLGGLATVAALLALLPLLYLAIVVVGDPAGALRPLERGRAWQLLGNSVLLAVLVTASATTIGVGLAWLIERTAVPGRAIWRVVAAIPLALPSYVAAYLLVSALGPRGELVQAFGPLLGIDRIPSIYGLPAAWLTLTLVSYPYVLLPVAAALRGLDPSLEEASRSLGRGALATTTRVVLPQLRPAIGAGALLVALYVLSDFGAVALSRYDTFTRAIFTSYKSSFDRSGAAGLAVMLVILTVVVLWFERRTRARGSLSRNARSSGRTARVQATRRARLAALTALLAVLLFTVALPLGMLVLWLVRAVGTEIDGGSLLTALGHSVIAALGAALVASLIALPIAMLSARSRRLGARLAEGAAYVGHALPGIVVALALVFLTLRAVPALYQTLAALVLALALLFLPQALGPQRAALLQMSPSISESARTLGAGPLRLLWRVQLPLIRRGLGAGAALVFLTAVKELPATLVLSPPEFPTLATKVWAATSTSAYEDAALPSLLLLLAGSLPLVIGTLQERRA